MTTTETLNLASSAGTRVDLLAGLDRMAADYFGDTPHQLTRLDVDTTISRLGTITRVLDYRGTATYERTSR